MTTPARDLVAAAFSDALGRAARQYGWQGWDKEAIEVEVPANAEHGDYATSIAMRLAKTLRKPPREVATAIKDQLDLRPPLAAADVAGGGFVNVRLDVAWLRGQVEAILRDGGDYGRSSLLRGKRIQVEFVSANPTGPLTLANARGGPLGDVLSSVLQFAGADVQREYYVEDGGTQVKRGIANICDAVDVVVKTVGENEARRILVENPRKILAGQHISAPAVRPAPPQKTLVGSLMNRLGRKGTVPAR